MKSPRKKRSGVGMPAALYLQEFGDVVMAAFGDCAYHVGSSLTGMSFRDVDVRVILEDDKYEAEGYGHPNSPHSNAKWRVMTQAFSCLGKHMTGLPMDFQIQQRTDANKNFDGERSALFTVITPISPTKKKGKK